MSSVLKEVPVSEVMSIKVYAISPDETVEHARNLMQGKHFGGLPVVDDKKLVGIVTLKDVKNIQIGKQQKTKIKDIMTKNVSTVSPNDNLSSALEKMTKLRVARLPVVSGSNALIGMITLVDIDKASKKLQKKKLSSSKSHKCTGCGASLKISISHIVKCEYCGRLNNL